MEGIDVRKPSFTLLLLAALPLAGQQIKFPPAFDKLAAKASETVNVNLDASMLGLAGRFISEDKPEEAAAKKLLGGLKGIYVRVFEFEKPGAYARADVDSIREQLRGPGWNCVFSAQKKQDEESVEICLHHDGDVVTGLTVLAAEPTELTVVNLVGLIRPEDLATLSGKFGIPKIKTGPKALMEPKTAPTKKDE
jgi:hypothetical protein